ncbi:MAG TPA: hypothetical protein VGE05_06830 [Novosphingobium sp.]
MNFPVALMLAALILGAIGLGGGLYEATLIDRAWPRLPQLIQPKRGGIDRKLFWIPMHTAYELALAGALWANWHAPFARYCTAIALAAHAITRAWSFLHFIPAALRFEEAGDLPPTQTAAALAWTRRSRWRIAIEAGAVATLALAVGGGIYS